MPKSSFTAILEKEGDLYVALCPELDVASQGATVEEATANMKGAVELFLECADSREIEARQHHPASREPFVALRSLSGSFHSNFTDISTDKYTHVAAAGVETRDEATDRT